MMKRRRFGSIGGRVDATFFLVFLSLSRGVVVVVARVYVYSRGAPFAFFLSLLVSLKNYYLGFDVSL
jgi:hypothetical protein